MSIHFRGFGHRKDLKFFARVLFLPDCGAYNWKETPEFCHRNTFPIIFYGIELSSLLLRGFSAQVWRVSLTNLQRDLETFLSNILSLVQMFSKEEIFYPSPMSFSSVLKISSYSVKKTIVSFPLHHLGFLAV